MTFFIQMIVFMIAFSAVTIWMAWFNLRVTRVAAQYTIPYRFRALARLMPVASIGLMTGVLVTGISEMPPVIIQVFGYSTLVSLGIQVLLVFMPLLSSSCRAVVFKTFEAKAVRLVVIAMYKAAKVFVLAYIYLFKLGLRSHGGKGNHAYDDPTQPGNRQGATNQDGHLSYDEIGRKYTGQRY